MNQIKQSRRPPSVLALLRALVPKRQLSYFEQLRIAELQANWLRSIFGLGNAAMAHEIIEDLPRIRVVRERGLPVSGAAHWNGRYWVITLNADEPLSRQHFSLMHEFKHILDHTNQHQLRYGRSAEGQVERVADYFAACVLMPKRVVTSLWCGGCQDLAVLATKLQVSIPALRYRLNQLGLLDEPRRCAQDRRMTARPGHRVPAAAGGAG